jgi:hypothetical protein
MAPELKIPELKDVIKGDLAQNGDWIVAGVNAQMPWPVNSQKVRYCGVDLWVLPVMVDHYPGVALNRPNGISREDAERLIMRFLSAVSWIERGGILLEHLTGGNLPRPMGRNQKFIHAIQEDFDLSYLPEPADEKSRLALALMREGRGLNHPAYAFLSFYRVLEVAVPGKKRGDWIAAGLDEIKDHFANQALAELRKRVDDIGLHLRESGRHAIAHAGNDPIINPDDPSDMRRLSSELPVVRALAELAIAKELGVETAQSVWEKHLYELAGFKQIIGQDILQTMEGEQQLNEKTNWPPLRVELRKREPYSSLARLHVVEAVIVDKTVVVEMHSSTGYVALRFRLDIPNERLVFDINSDTAMKDDGSAEAAEAIAELCRFVRDYWGNGQLRILNADTGVLISRKDAFIPVNMWLDQDAADAVIEQWKAKAEERRRSN